MNGHIPSDKGVCTLISAYPLNDLWVDCDKLICPSTTCCTKCGNDGIDPESLPGAGNNKPSGPTTGTNTDEERAAAIKTKLETISFPIAGEDRVKALDWITNIDGLELSADSPHLVHRYILAVFYYALDGDNWDIEENEISWLSGLSHCYWVGIACAIGGNGAVMSIDMGKSRMFSYG